MFLCLRTKQPMTTENNTPRTFTVRAYVPGQTHEHAERNTPTPYAFGVFVQSVAKGYEGTWIFCGFATDAKRAAALAKREGGVIVPTVIL